MCGRFVNFLKERETVEEFGVAEVTADARGLAPSWNVAPQQVAPIVTPMPEGPGRRLVAARWGLVPSWSKDARAGARLFNARSETAHSKPAFRSAFARRRCLVPANGYYEWEATADGKRPYYIHPADGAPAAFAGLWEAWEGDGPPLLTFTILTTGARGDLARIHDRSPVILARGLRDAWMDPETTVDEARAIAGSPPADVVAHPVSTDVGRVRNNHPGLICPLNDDSGGRG
jgi:putative SOS response-associated peptidase YedK